MKKFLVVAMAVMALTVLVVGQGFAAPKLVVNDTLLSPKFVVTDAVNVGIGTNTPADILDVYSENNAAMPGISVYRYVDSGVAPNFRGFKARGTSAAAPSAVQAGDVAFSLLGFAYESTTPSFKQIAAFRTAVESISGANIGSFLRFDTSSSSGALRETMRLNSNGNLGIGTTNPTHPLVVCASPGSGTCVYNDGTTSWTASSREYKENIMDLSANKALDTLKNLKPVTFRYKEIPDQGHVGFVAEDVPELVASKDRKALSPMDIVAVLTKVVQEQNKTIEALSAKIEKLEKASTSNTNF